MMLTDSVKDQLKNTALGKLRDEIIKGIVLSLPMGMSPFLSGVIAKISTILFNKYIQPKLVLFLDYIEDMNELRIENKKLKKQIKALKNSMSIEDFNMAVDNLD